MCVLDCQGPVESTTLSDSSSDGIGGLKNRRHQGSVCACVYVPTRQDKFPSRLRKIKKTNQSQLIWQTQQHTSSFGKTGREFQHEARCRVQHCASCYGYTAGTHFITALDDLSQSVYPNLSSSSNMWPVSKQLSWIFGLSPLWVCVPADTLSILWVPSDTSMILNVNFPSEYPLLKDANNLDKAHNSCCSLCCHAKIRLDYFFLRVAASNKVKASRSFWSSGKIGLEREKKQR